MNTAVIEWIKDKYNIYIDIIEIDNNYMYKIIDIKTNNSLYTNYFKFMAADTAEVEAIKRSFKIILEKNQ